MGIHFRRFDENDRTVFSFGLTLENGRTDCIIDVRDRASQVLIFLSCPSNVPENKRNLVAEFLTRANYGLILGNFEMDYSDGQVRYKSAYLYSEVFHQADLIFSRNFIAASSMMDKYFPGIMAIIFGRISPQDAISQVENIVNPTIN